MKRKQTSGKIMIKDMNIEYIATYKAIKNIIFRIENGILYLSLPNRIKKADIEKIIMTKANWIFKHIKLEKERNEEKIKSKKRFESDKVGFYLGKEVKYDNKAFD